jgi:hypothetical protein
LIKTDFKDNKMDRIRQYATPKCKFTVGAKVKVTEGLLTSYPFSGSKDAKIDHIHCKTPIWKLDTEDSEKASLDVSLNGQNYLGAGEFIFLRALKLHRDSPMSGPQNKATPVDLIG